METQFYDFTRHSSFLGLGVYRVDSPNLDNLYAIYLERGISEEEITRILNLPIIWLTDRDGFVTLQFYFDVYIVEVRKYRPEQLANLILFYGAIYTFYNTILTPEDIEKIEYSYVKNRFIQNGYDKFVQLLNNKLTFKAFLNEKIKMERIDPENIDDYAGTYTIITSAL